MKKNNGTLLSFSRYFLVNFYRRNFFLQKIVCIILSIYEIFWKKLLVYQIIYAENNQTEWIRVVENVV